MTAAGRYIITSNGLTDWDPDEVGVPEGSIGVLANTVHEKPAGAGRPPGVPSQPRATPQISTVMSSVCMWGWGTSVTGGSGPGVESATASRNALVVSGVPSEAK
jgi:hypothetical protein